MSGPLSVPTDPLVEELAARLGAGAVLTGDEVASRPAGWHGAPSRAAAIVRPSSIDGVVEVLRLCHAARRPVVAHGGRTGLADGAVTAPGDIALSLERLNAIEAVDVDNRTMRVQAGVPLQAVQERAEAAGLFFPQDLGGRGSATVGGMISTNAGGNRVIRYGMMRDMVLGVEAVLADGTVVSSLAEVIKNNTGYDLRQLFIGSEGTLGIVTRAVLRLRPAPRSESTALLAVPDFPSVSRLLNALEGALGGTLSTFEVMWRSFYELSARTAYPDGHPPLAPDAAPYVVLVESLGGDPEGDPARFERALEGLYAEGLASDAVIAHSGRERDALWAVRDNVECLDALSPSVLFDVSVAIGDMEGYLAEIDAALAARWPERRMVVFGHLGDGNLHVIVTVGDGASATRREIERCVLEPLAGRGGSISAEHGIGLAKKPYLHLSRSPAEIGVMRALKQALDPHALLNPGKVLPDREPGT